MTTSELENDLRELSYNTLLLSDNNIAESAYIFLRRLYANYIKHDSEGNYFSKSKLIGYFDDDGDYSLEWIFSEFRVGLLVTSEEVSIFVVTKKEGTSVRNIKSPLGDVVKINRIADFIFAYARLINGEVRE